MAKRLVDLEHLKWVATKPCMICNKRPVQVHHLLKPYDGARGMGRKSGDNNVIPLCYHHHAELHTKFGSEKLFFDKYWRNEHAGKILAEDLYKQSLYIRNNDDNDLPF